MTPENTYVLLIAVGKYEKDPQLHKLEQTYRNIDGLYRVLKDTSIIGIPSNNIDYLPDPENIEEVGNSLDVLVQKDNAETIIIYYAGHGVIDDVDGKYYLTTKNSTVNRIDRNGFSISGLKSSFKEKRNLEVIIILDSCFSERAFDGFDMTNFFVVASSAKSKTSKYPIDEDYSVFTNELITILKEGIDTEGKDLTWNNVYTRLEENLSDKRFPQPKKTSRGNIAESIIKETSAPMRQRLKALIQSQIALPLR